MIADTTVTLVLETSEPVALAAPNPHLPEWLALKQSILLRVHELETEAPEYGETSITSRAVEAVLSLSHVACPILFAHQGPFPAIFSTESGGADFVLHNTRLQRRLLVQISPGGQPYRCVVVTKDGAYGPLEGPRAEDEMRSLVQWVVGEI